jgi:hypothetical protein
VGASAWTGYRYYTDPPFRSRLNDLWASLSKSATAATSSSGSIPTPAAEALPNEQQQQQQQQQQEQEQRAYVAGSSTGPEPLETTGVAVEEDALPATAHDAHEEAVVALPDSFIVAVAPVVEEPQAERKEEEEEEVLPSPAAGGPIAEVPDSLRASCVGHMCWGRW